MTRSTQFAPHEGHLHRQNETLREFADRRIATDHGPAQLESEGGDETG